MRRNWTRAGGILALAVGIATSAGAQAPQGETAFTCTNAASKATWQIRIDYGRQTVDTYPAKISDGEISWRDPRDMGNYTLERKSGKLTVAIPSSTGGYFVYGHCQLEKK